VFTDRTLPDSFLQRLKELETSYLAETDPIRQSGFGGGPGRWRDERRPILDAVTGDGDLLDIGCANGYLLECLMKWGRERGLTLTPFGLDWSEKLISLTRKRLPRYDSHFFVGNAWDWQPDRKFQYVYSVFDCVPEEYLEEFLHRLLCRVVSPGGRLIIGAYGSRTDNIAPFDIESFLKTHGFNLAGSAEGGRPPVTKFVWVVNTG
jgi:SAM-dependent methyltransferase